MFNGAEALSYRDCDISNIEEVGFHYALGI
jgi:hypothetical protein